jgi:hypothetical protein
MSLLNSLDTSTATLSYLAFNPSTSILFKYTTLARNASVNATTVDAIGASTADPVAGPHDFSDYQWEDDEASNITDVRVDYTTRALQPNQVLWTSPDVPFTVTTGTNRTDWASFSDPALSVTESHTATNMLVTLTPFYQSAKIQFDGSGVGGTISDFTISGRPLTAMTRSVQYVSGLTPVVVAPVITAEFVPSTAAAAALAQWIFYASNGSGVGYPHLSGTVENMFPTQIARKVTDPVDIILGRVDASSREYLIRSVATTVDMGAANWTTTYGLQRYTQDVTLLILDTGHLDSGSDATLGL